MTAADLALWLALWLTPTALIFAWIAADTWLAVRADRAESSSERNHRIDAEARAACAPDFEANVAARRQG